MILSVTMFDEKVAHGTNASTGEQALAMGAKGTDRSR
jgi:hypothetical protein